MESHRCSTHQNKKYVHLPSLNVICQTKLFLSDTRTSTLLPLFLPLNAFVKYLSNSSVATADSIDKNLVVAVMSLKAITTALLFFSTTQEGLVNPNLSIMGTKTLKISKGISLWIMLVKGCLMQRLSLRCQ